MAQIIFKKVTSEPSTGVANEIQVYKDTTNDWLSLWVGDTSGTARLIADTREHYQVAIDTPASGDRVIMFHTPRALTILQVRAIVEGTTGDSVQVTIESASAENAGSPTVNVNAQTVSWASTNSGGTPTIASASVAANNWVWLELPTVGGSPTSVTVVIRTTWT